MGRAPCCDKVGLKKGPWTPEEDQKLISYIQQHGHGSWRALPQKAGLLRCGKSCRLRWANYLRPDIKRGKFTPQEEQTIIQLHALLGNRWSAIATHLPKRTDNEIKNYWNTHLKKRLLQMGIDPVTHKPRSDPLASPSAVCPPSSHISHMAQWESARLEAESRLVRESKLRARGLWPPPTAAPPGPAHKSATVGWGADSAAGAATVAVSEPLFTSYLGLLQHAMCAEKPPQIPLLPAAHVLSATSEGRGSTTDDGGGGDSFLNNCSSAAASEISDLSKTSEINNNNNNNINIIGSNGNRNMNVSSVKSEVALTEEFQALPNEEITSSTSNFSGDSLLDLVAPLTSEGANDDEDGDEDHKDYWSRMFNICSSPTHCTTNSSVHSIF